MKTLIIDNYDSFTFNLYQYVGELDERPLVVRNDRITVDEVKAMRPDRIIISPGPGNPEDPAYFGVCRAVIAELGPRIPLLGVCLGHQGICAAFGGRVIRAPYVMHGKTSIVTHDNSELYTGISAPFEVMRYHSLVADPDTFPDCLRVTSRTEDGIIMGLRHVSHPIFGVQFHPESIGTGAGRRLIENFLFLDERALRESAMPPSLSAVSQPASSKS